MDIGFLNDKKTYRDRGADFVGFRIFSTLVKSLHLVSVAQLTGMESTATPVMAKTENPTHADLPMV